ncbi:MAG: hypothetical protein GF310_08225 [candidate division Zixibacteria bacterium]|nr:hypothetical protein [candidate division Zixibacteria bacterium]
MDSVQSHISRVDFSNRWILLLIFFDLLVLTALTFLSPMQAIGVIVVLFLAAYFFLSPLGYLYFLLIWMPYETLLLPEGDGVRILRLLAISLIIILGWSKYWLSGNSIRFPNRYLLLPIIAVFLWSAMTVFFSPMPLSAMFEFIKMLAYLAIFFLAYNIISTRKDFRKLLYFMFIISIPIYIAAYYQFFALGFLRVWGIFGNPNTLGLFSFTTAGMALLLRELKEKSKLTSIIVIVWLLFSVSSLILSGSRASIFGLAIFGSAYLILKRKYIILLILILAGGLGAYYIMQTQALFTDFARVTRLMAGLTGRTIIWDTTLEMIKDYPTFGVGPGNVSGLLYNYAQATHPIVNIDLRFAMEEGLTHNGYLQQLAEIGIVGLLLVLWAIYRFIRFLSSIISSDNRENISGPALVVLTIFVGRLAHSFFESSLDVGPFTLDMSILLAYIAIIKLKDNHT